MGRFLEYEIPQKSKFLKKTVNKSWSPSPIFFTEMFFLERFDRFSTPKDDFENQNFEMFEEVVLNFGKSDGNFI